MLLDVVLEVEVTSLDSVVSTGIEDVGVAVGVVEGVAVGAVVGVVIGVRIALPVQKEVLARAPAHESEMCTWSR